jgi:hypothetical protein
MSVAGEIVCSHRGEIDCRSVIFPGGLETTAINPVENHEFDDE